MFLRLLAVVVLLGGVAIGCDGPRYVALDSGTTDAPSPMGTLTLVSASSLALRPGETASIDVRFADASGAPGAGIAIAAAIEGTALDSTLGALGATTDASGLAHVALVAGTEAATFRVRLSAREAAAPVYLYVGVGASFGSLRVRAPYLGARPVTQRVIDVVPGMTCPALAAMPPASGGRTVTSLTDDVAIAALPTTLTYAVLVRAQGAIATEAVGCADGVMPVADVATDVDVTLTEVPLGLDGNYTVDASLDGGGYVRDRVAEWTYALRATTSDRGGDATMLLDEIEAELIGAGAGTDAAQLHTLRGTLSLDDALAAQLAADGSAPTETIAALLDEAGTALDAPDVSLALTLGAGDMGTLTTERLVCGDGAGGTVSIAMTPAAVRTISTAATLDAMFAFLGPVDAPPGTLALAWSEAVARERGHAGGVDELLAGTCASLETFAASADGATALAACDATCRASACRADLADLMARVAAGGALADSDIGGARIIGMISARDDDGDARVDRLDGTITGTFVDAMGNPVGPSDAVTGTLSGARAAVP